VVECVDKDRARFGCELESVSFGRVEAFDLFVDTFFSIFCLFAHLSHGLKSESERTLKVTSLFLKIKLFYFTFCLFSVLWGRERYILC